MASDDEPQSWHHGLMAAWWAEFNTDAAREAEYFQALIVREGEPALDLACGTGRVLLPLLAAGLDVDGCDVSMDMLALCKQKTERAGFAPNLYQQAMHALDLPRAYRTIYICDSFGIGGYRAHDAEALMRCHHQLAPGGVLVFNHYLPYDNPDLWQYWLSGQRQELPREWPADDAARRRALASGDELELVTRIAAFDPIEQRVTLEMRVRRWSGEQVVEEEYGSLQENHYFYKEVEMLLMAAGFADVTATGVYSDAPMTAEQTQLMIVARK